MFRCNLGGGGGGGSREGATEGRGTGSGEGILNMHIQFIGLKCKLVSMEKGSNGNSTMGTQSIRTWAAEPRQ